MNKTTTIGPFGDTPKTNKMNDKQNASEAEKLILANQQVILMALSDIIFRSIGRCPEVNQLHDAYNQTDIFLEKEREKLLEGSK